jgi:hypothetical protein
MPCCPGRPNCEKQIGSLSREQRGTVIGQVRALMSDHGLTLADLEPARALPGDASKERSHTPLAAAVASLRRAGYAVEHRR